jgi:hypothetical protein
MAIPRWNDPHLKAGTKIRSALWLISEVGVGNSFTKEQHRAAFAGVAQADRRLRDLRDFGWVIHTSAEDITLNADEQRFVSIGKPVWERGIRSNVDAKVLTPKMRRKTLAESDYQCSICGIAGGEKYPDAPQVAAVLAVSSRPIIVSDGNIETMFISECKRCRSAKQSGPDDIPKLLANINKLSASDRAVFEQWVANGRRSSLDRVWAVFRCLPKAGRDIVSRKLKRD